MGRFRSPAALLLLQLLLLLLLHLGGLEASCTGRRTVLTNQTGFVSDGPGNYPERFHCEWLIDAGSARRFITITFLQLDTECSYDYVFIYDGNNYSAPTLATLSGPTVPPPLTATSGYMLVHLYSDTNYARAGFNASYEIHDCPADCNEHGSCSATLGRCSCYPGWKGDSCHVEICPEGCGEARGRGTCSAEAQRCVCEDGYAGDSCSLHTLGQQGDNAWHNVSCDGCGLAPRAAHAAAYLPDTGALWLFGGYTLNAILGDLVAYNFSEGRWVAVTTTAGSAAPSARYGHAMAAYDGALWMYGGATADGSYSDELWTYDPAGSRWRRRGAGGDARLPGLAGHSLTLVRDRWLYLYGGIGDDELSSAMFRVDVRRAGATWERVVHRNGKGAPHRVVGHSAVFHAETASLLVYGGFAHREHRAWFGRRVAALWAYHVDENVWLQLETGDSGAPYLHPAAMPPAPRAYHSANIIGNYMVVYGGNAYLADSGDLCHDRSMHFYHLGCQTWVDFPNLAKAFAKLTDTADDEQRAWRPLRGRFAHTAVVRDGNTLLIAGGYAGFMRGDLLAFTMPPFIALNAAYRRQHPQASVIQCSVHGTQGTCQLDPECVQCKVKTTDATSCIHRSKQQDCEQGSLQSSQCPGICEKLRTCEACMVLGRGVQMATPSVAEATQVSPCQWWGPRQMCYSIGNMYRRRHSTLAWWGNQTTLTSLQQCRTKDQWSGLTKLQYRHPANYSQPDYVENIPESQLEFKQSSEPGGAPKRELLIGKYFTIMLRGFIHTSALSLSDRYDHSVWVYSSYTNVIVNISANAAVQETVSRTGANRTESMFWQQAHHMSGLAVLPGGSRDNKLYLSLLASQQIHEDQHPSMVKLAWGSNRKVFERLALQPWAGEPSQCMLYANCLVCIADGSCGWCHSTRSCVAREGAAVCMVGDEESHLVYIVSECPLCSDHVNCRACVENGECEWLLKTNVTNVSCVRRGRFDVATRDAARCSLPCSHYDSCAACTSLRNECAWCESTRTCFPFHTYLASYGFGNCREWMDNENLCKNCSKHDGCKKCLRDFQCGWCGNVKNPTLGLCVDGDFAAPYSDVKCPHAVNARHELRATAAAEWSYGTCPDVDECGLLLHDCHDNATCANTLDSYACRCDRGFVGNGRDVCNKTCYDECVHGVCSGAPLYECSCHLGWTGVNCTVNCGCHNHSVCPQGLGICDNCEEQTWTEGEHCEFCREGSFGNATSSGGCVECRCNAHGNASLGVCDSATGNCYCVDNTEGGNCERCRDGYFGNPTNGGRCYLNCDGRMLITNVTTSGLGNHAGKGIKPVNSQCLWIISAYADFPPPPPSPSSSPPPAISLTVDSLSMSCGENYVYVYDGVPPSLASDATAVGGAPAVAGGTLLAAFCGRRAPPRGLTVQARSGYLTVYATENWNLTRQRFTAIFQIHACPGSCSGNWECKPDGSCGCRDGFGGPDCETEHCPGNCSWRLHQGFCDHMLNRCVCDEGFSGGACDVATAPHHAAFTPLRDAVAAADAALSDSGPAFRSAHALVAHGNRLFLRGGISLASGELADMYSYDVDSDGPWRPFGVGEGPGEEEGAGAGAGRYHDATAADPTGLLYAYGGISGGRIVGDFTVVDLNTGERRTLETEFVLGEGIGDKTQSTLGSVPPLAGHTLTYVGDSTLVLLGGYAAADPGPGGFSGRVYRCVMPAPVRQRWSRLQTHGVAPIGLYGHSAVYHPPSGALYVFGGYEYYINRTSISAKLYALDLLTLAWQLLAPIGSVPVPRFFHAAVTTNDFMLVAGGRTAKREFDNVLVIYRYACNEWSSLHDLAVSNGDPLAPAIGRAAAAIVRPRHVDVYLLGGYGGVVNGELVRLRLPIDLCNLQTDQTKCLQMNGCAMCMNVREGTSICYSNSRPAPSICSGERSRRLEGVQCNSRTVVSERSCSHYATCSACLSTLPIYSQHDESSPMCQWCTGCGGCRRRGDSCTATDSSRAPQSCVGSSKIINPMAINISSHCHDRTCHHSTCDDCTTREQHCMWTRNILRRGDHEHILNVSPVYAWNCVTSKLLSNIYTLKPPIYKMETVQTPDACPATCHSLDSCEDCLQSIGADGGWNSCRWSSTLNLCMSPSFVALRCSHGECGAVQSLGQKQLVSQQCPKPCNIYKTCASCLTQPGCGWCALKSMNGLGACYKGGITGPAHCSGQTPVDLHPRKHDGGRNWTDTVTSEAEWTFFSCPAEDECVNNHHTCNTERETCVDRPDGFTCNCKDGYTLDKGGTCQPQCDNGCDHGTCVKPNVCRCFFGFVGANCSSVCDCNGHSNCKGVNALDTCLQCHNNTQGDKCEKCLRYYVGDAKNNGTCISCSSFCHGHASKCLSADIYHNNSLRIFTLNGDLDLVAIEAHVKEGPRQDAVCLKCANNTDGDRCDRCLPGFFRPDTNRTLSCLPCQCNLHDDTCDADGGLHCDCHNNTETPACDKQKGSCYLFQCSRCKDGFLGQPVEGKQCYKQMLYDRGTYCFDPFTQGECSARRPNPLLAGRTMFFAVQPSYKNVDIRVTIDVSDGAVDVYFAQTEHLFEVHTDNVTGIQHVGFNSDYLVLPYDEEAATRDDAGVGGRYRRGARRAPLESRRAAARFWLRERTARPYHAFLTLAYRRFVLLVTDVRYRLVLTLPYRVHRLENTRFFVVVRGRAAAGSYGNLFFRQDQPHIDLFVFFSVFFSAFFLFLALCVLAWKVKQASDVRHARHMHAMQMEHMASRPFGRATVFVDDDADDDDYVVALPPKRKRDRRGGAPPEMLPPAEERHLAAQPVALEPTDDGIAAVGTLLLRLPGGDCAPVKICLGSSLVTMRVMYPASQHHPKYGVRSRTARNHSYA